MTCIAKNIGVFGLAAALALPLPASADDGEPERERENDHQRREAVRQSVEQGEIKPLLEVMRAVRPKLPGDIVGIEAERKRDTWIYEFRVADPQGHMYEAYVDAATAEILTIEEK